MGRLHALVGFAFWTSFEVINGPKRKARINLFLNAGGIVLEAAARHSHVL